MESKLGKIEIPQGWGPFDLMKNWIEEFKTESVTPFVPFNLATTTKDGVVKNRSIGLQELADDGVIFNCNVHSPKVKHITENPNVAACFLFIYRHTKTKWVTRQIRLEGVAVKQDEIDPEFYQSQPLYAKLRNVLIPEPGVEVDWDELKKKHDELLDKVNKGELILNPPENLVVYKIVPKQFEFYQACRNEIADRVVFRNTSGKWTYCHITA